MPKIIPILSFSDFKSEDVNENADNYLNEKEFEKHLDSNGFDEDTYTALLHNAIETKKHTLIEYSLEEHIFINECLCGIRRNTDICQRLFKKSPKEMFVFFDALQTSISYNIRVLRDYKELGFLKADEKYYHATKVKKGKAEAKKRREEEEEQRRVIAKLSDDKLYKTENDPLQKDWNKSINQLKKKYQTRYNTNQPDPTKENIG